MYLPFPLSLHLRLSLFSFLFLFLPSFSLRSLLFLSSLFYFSFSFSSLSPLFLSSLFSFHLVFSSLSSSLLFSLLLRGVFCVVHCCVCVCVVTLSGCGALLCGVVVLLWCVRVLRVCMCVGCGVPAVSTFETPCVHSKRPLCSGSTSKKTHAEFSLAPEVHQVTAGSYTIKV